MQSTRQCIIRVVSRAVASAQRAILLTEWSIARVARRSLLFERHANVRRER
jgi:hypothetical protein